MEYDILYQLFMGLLQGLTEWLPVSSSGHLVVAQHFFDVKERTLFDAILHLGTLLAMTMYFRKDIKPLLSFKKPLTFKIIIASIPIILIGFIFADVIEDAFADTSIAATFLIINGCVLMVHLFLDRKSKGEFDKHGKEGKNEEQKNTKNSKTNNEEGNKELHNISMKNTILIGLFQIFALFPGISRSGTTITTGRILKLDWKTAAKFSFFISFLPVAGAVWFKVLTAWEEFEPIYLLGFFVAFVVGYASIDIMMKILSRGQFHYFGIYTIIIGVIMLTLIL
jgi:undecaprenyl-diphosphatase